MVKADRGTSIIEQSNMLKYSFMIHKNIDFVEDILVPMKEDSVKEIILDNQSVQDVGLFLHLKYGPNRPEESRQCMRVLARLLPEARK